MIFISPQDFLHWPFSDLLFLQPLALLIASTPINSTNTTSGLRWTGEIPGHGSVTLYGSVDAVEKQIFDLVPTLRENYAVTNPFMSPSPRPFNDTAVTVSNLSYSYDSTDLTENTSIASRSDIDLGIDVNSGPYSETHWYCGNFATGSCESFHRDLFRCFSRFAPSRRWALPLVLG